MSNYIAKNLRWCREKQGLTLEELGTKLGLNKSKIVHYERGVEPSIETIIKMCDLFEVDIREFVLRDFQDGKMTFEQAVSQMLSTPIGTPPEKPKTRKDKLAEKDELIKNLSEALNNLTKKK